MFRDPTERERGLLGALLSSAFEGSAGLMSQLKEIRVSPIDADGSLTLKPKSSKPATVLHRIPVEGSYPDSDGVRVHVLLHVKDGLLHELEVFREDAGVVSVPPSADKLDVDTHGAG
jgi:hypothetical protein